MSRLAMQILIGLASAFVVILILIGVVIWLLLRSTPTPLDIATEDSTPEMAFTKPISVTFLDEEADAYAARIEELFDTQDFGDWEREANAALTNTDRFADGRSMEEIFFDTFDDRLYGWNANTPGRSREVIADWKRLQKGSEAARIAELFVQIDDAWTERGGGFASTVTDEGWDGFRHYMDEAEESYWACLDAGIDHAIVYVAGLQIALGQSWSRDATEETFLAGFEKDPLCRSLYRQMAWYLMPKWYGSSWDAERFFYQSRDLAGPYAGGAMAFYVASYFDHQLGEKNRSFEFSIPWEDLEPAYVDFARLFPDAVAFHNRMAQLACNYGMKDYAANLFETSAATHHADIWALQAYQGWREWAVNNGPPPMFSDLHQAALDGDVEAIEAILAEGVDVDYVDHEGLTPLFYAVREEKRDAALALLQAGANPNAIVDGDNHTILWRAIQYSLKDMAALLMEHGGDLMAEYKPGEQLYFLLYYRDMQDLAERAIREFGVDVDFQSATGNTALRTAASEGDLDTVKWLLALGADIDVRTSSGRTPLSIAIDNEKEDVALYLIEQGADVTISASNGWSPLMGAADAGFINVVKALLARGADVRDEDDTGWTALHMAVMDGELEILKLLLDAPGADIDTITHERRTLIHQAAKSGHIMLIEFLVARGVEINSTTDVGKTPLDYAIEENKTEAAEYLESIGGVRGNTVEAAAAG